MNKNGRKKDCKINELYKKSKTPAGLTSAEKEEQKNLSQEYIFAMKQNLRSVLNNIDIKEPDGSIPGWKISINKKSMMEQTKAELRKQYKQKRRALTPEQVTVASAQIRSNF